MADDTRFLAASHLALAIVERFGNAADERKAEAVGVLTFFLLEWFEAAERQETIGRVLSDAE